MIIITTKPMIVVIGAAFLVVLAQQQDGDAPVGGVAGVVGEQRLALGQARHAADRGFRDAALRPAGGASTLARSAERSQLERAPGRKGVASVWPVMETALGTRLITAATFASSARASSAGTLPPRANIGWRSASRIWMRRPSGVCSTCICCARSASAGSSRTAARTCSASRSSTSRSRFSCSSRSASLVAW